MHVRRAEDAEAGGVDGGVVRDDGRPLAAAAHAAALTEKERQQLNWHSQL